MIKRKLTPRLLKTVKNSESQLIIPWHDFETFCSYCKIRSGNEIKDFNLYSYQTDFAKLIDSHSVIVCCKSRQLGLTQVILAKFIYKALFNKAYVAVIYQRNQADSSNIARRARQILDSLYQFGIVNESDNLGYMKVKNGGEIHFKNSSKEGSRSLDSVSDFLFDESAFSDNIKDIYNASSASSAMVKNGCKILVSTPNIKSGFFWDMLNNNNPLDVENAILEIKNGLTKPFHYWLDSNKFCKVLIHWKAHPIYSQNPNYLEYRKLQDGTDFETVSREYDLTFVNSSESVFNAIDVKNCLQDIDKSKRYLYYFGIDTATTGNDFTVCQVLGYDYFSDSFNVVETYRKNKESFEYHLYQISELMSFYKPENVGVEITGGVGQLYLEQLLKLHPSQQITPIKTSNESKHLMINRLKLLIEKAKIKFNKNDFIVNELLSFKRTGNKLEASQGKHDDIIMATAFSLAVSNLDSEKIVNIQRYF